MTEYIEREMAIKDFEYLRNKEETSLDLREVQERLQFLIPAADVAPVVHGKWIDYSEPDEDGNCQCHCSNCYAGDVQRVGEKVPYCWKCGAKMDLEGLQDE